MDPLDFLFYEAPLQRDVKAAVARSSLLLAPLVLLSEGAEKARDLGSPVRAIGFVQGVPRFKLLPIADVGDKTASSSSSSAASSAPSIASHSATAQPASSLSSSSLWDTLGGFLGKAKQ